MKRTIHKYSEASLAKALKKIRSGEMGIRKAGKEYGIPTTTLHDRIHGKVPDGPRRMGPKTVLSETEEKKIVEWLLTIAKCGCPQKPDELLDVVQKIIRDENRKTPFKDDRPGKKWYYSFLKRHEELTLRNPEAINKARAVVTEENIRKWFRDLEKYLIAENCPDILQDPTRIYNGDETSFSMAPKTGTVIAPKGYRNLYQVKFGQEKDTLTVLLVFAASGETLPPMIIFPYLRPPAKIVNSMPDDWILGRSETGWMRTETFYEYVANGYNDWLNKNNIKRPVLFLVDGHKSHLSLQISEFCANNQIILYSLPPNTTHLLQPADVGAFKGLKSDYKKTVREWNNLHENFGKAITKTNFCELLKTVLDKTDRSGIVKNSFRKCGIFPFSADAVDYTKCVENYLEKLSKSKDDGLNNEKYEAAKEVILSLETDLYQKDIDAQIVLETIKTAQEKNRFLTLPESNVLQAESESISCTDMRDGTYEIHNGDLVIVEPVTSMTTAMFHTSDMENCTENCLQIEQAMLSDILCNDFVPEIPVSPSTRTLVNCSPISCSSFDKHLKFPDPKKTKKGKVISAEKRPPMSIVSARWKEFHQGINRVKEKKTADVKKRKEERLKKLMVKNKRLNAKVSKRKTPQRLKLRCFECEDDLDTDTEEESLKNIGCDQCDKWYHLKCTTLSNIPFIEAEAK